MVKIQTADRQRIRSGNQKQQRYVIALERLKGVRDDDAARESVTSEAYITLIYYRYRITEFDIMTPYYCPRERGSDQCELDVASYEASAAHHWIKSAQPLAAICRISQRVCEPL